MSGSAPETASTTRLDSLAASQAPEIRPPTSPVVHVMDASVRLGGRTVWDGVRLAIQPGELVAVLGPNGAGKSTLLRAILGLTPLAGGRITVLGEEPRRARRHIGFVPQRRFFGADVRIRGRDLIRLGIDGDHWGLPITDLLTLGRGSHARSVNSAIESIAGLVHAGHIIDRAVGELSGGEQQRILIAQALVTRPRLLLLDEPLESLDLASQGEVAHLIHEVTSELGTAVMLVAHDVNPILPFVDRICYLAAGHAAVGRPGDVITSEVLSRLYGAEIEVLHSRSGRLIVVGQPEGIPCLDHHHEPNP